MTLWECQFIEISSYRLKHTLTFGNIYLPPRNTQDIFINDLILGINNFDKCNKKLVLIGDYNFDLLIIDRCTHYTH